MFLFLIFSTERYLLSFEQIELELRIRIGDFWSDPIYDKTLIYIQHTNQYQEEEENQGLSFHQVGAEPEKKQCHSRLFD